ncbi:ParB/RepB/Spo0J family partition protein [Salinispora arenicola]|uniref:ParB/RepB/Spo0J family partition protein n=1 Tax=Salinispora arenicola TaxID=168697 RepID=UPI0009B767FA|nr:ParB N-terminal domain-containing protein [Salinispora arenicola]
MPATVEAQKPYITEADPREILAANSESDANIRATLGNLEDLAASIGESATGMIQFPVLVPREDGTMRLVAGFRRVTAAIEAHIPTIAFVVRSDWTHLSLASIKAAMIKENTHRKPLTVKEEADAYAQLALFKGMTAQKIAKETGRKKEFVEGQLALAKLTDDKAVSLANEGRLNPRSPPRSKSSKTIREFKRGSSVKSANTPTPAAGAANTSSTRKRKR